MKYNFEERIIEIDDELVNAFNKAMVGTEVVDDDLIAMYLSSSDYYDEDKDNILEVADKLIAEGTCDEFINSCIKNELFLD